MRKSINELMYNAVNDDLKDYVKSLGEITINCRLDELLIKHEMNQKEFAKLTGLREGTISEFKNLKKLNINIGTLVIIMSVLGITDITDVIEIEFNSTIKIIQK